MREIAFARGFRTEPKILVSEWADKFRFLGGNAAAERGKWRTSRTPYMREIVDCLSPYSPIERVVLQKGGQLGGTEGLLNWLGSIMQSTPGPTLFVFPTVEVGKRVSKSRIAPMIEETPILREIVSDARSRDSGNTISVKEFPGGTLIITGANSAAGLSSMPIRFLLCDEVDRFPGEIEEEGDPIDLAEERTATFFNRKIALVSTPTERGVSRIEKEYLATDQRRHFVPCPACGRFDFLTWSGSKDLVARTDEEEDRGHFRIEWDEGDPSSARAVCGACDARIPESLKREMLHNGEWRAMAKGPPRVAGFHLSGLYSPWKSWAERARQFVKAKPNPVALRSFVNMALGETYEERGDSVAPRTIADRAETYDGVVPTGVGVIVAAVDVQGDRLEVILKGYGAGEESWLLAYEQLYGDPGKDAVWSDLAELLERRLPHENGRRLKIDVAVIDSGGAFAERVYRFCAARPDKRVFPIKGGSEPGKPLVNRPSSKNRFRTKLFVLGVDTGKEIIYSRLTIAPPRTPEPTPGLMHFPAWVADDPEYVAQLTAEKAIRKWIKGKGSIRVWQKLRERNEALDLEVYALAGLYILGRGFLATLGDRAAEMAKPVKVEAPKEIEPGSYVPQAMRRRLRKNYVTGWKDP